MIKILFICHGNICRSPMAEFVMKDIVKKAGAEDRYYIASAATTYEEIGNPVYPPARHELAKHGIGCSGKTARRMTREDYDNFDLLIGMDDENMRDMRRFYGGDPDNKLRNLPDYYGDIGGSIADPWYTRNFTATWNDVLAGCTELFKQLEGTGGDIVTLDFSACETRHELFDVIRGSISWEDDYPNNFDALYDVLTDLHDGRRFNIILPSEDSAMRRTAETARRVFEDAGLLAE